MIQPTTSDFCRRAAARPLVSKRPPMLIVSVNPAWVRWVARWLTALEWRVGS